jgi:hypothetical protein
MILYEQKSKKKDKMTDLDIFLSSITYEDVEKAVSSLVDEAQRSKIDNYQKILLSEALSENPNNYTSTLYERITSKKLNIDDLLKKASIEVRPKEIEYINDKEIDISNVPSKLVSVKLFNPYYRLPVDIQVIEAIWCDKEGRKIDKHFSNDIYGNRIGEQSLFENYWYQYTKWRDGAFDKVKLQRTPEKKNIYNLDIRRFYYSIKMCNLHPLLEGYNTDLLNHIWKHYSEVIQDYDSELVGTLPVGPLSSGICANLILSEFDKSIKNTSGVIYYGRYVDDILLILEQKYVIDFQKLFVKNKETMLFSSSNNPFQINNEKVKIFEYNPKFPWISYNAFMEIIESSSSEWRLLPVDSLKTTASYRQILTYSETDSTNKPKIISTIKPNRHKLSTTLAKYIIVLSSIDTFDEVKDSISEFIRFTFSGGEAFDFIGLWSYAFTVLKLMDNEEDIVFITDTLINQIQNSSASSFQEQQCKQYLQEQLQYAYYIACANARKPCDMRTINTLSSIDNSVRQKASFLVDLLLRNSFTRKLMFNDKFSFDDIMRYYQIDDSEFILNTITNNTLSTSEKLIQSNLFKSSELVVSIAHKNIDTTSILDSILSKRTVSPDDLSKISKPIDDAINNKSDLLVFPETSIPERHIRYVIEYARIKKISIIAGIEHCKYKGVIGNFVLFIISNKSTFEIMIRPKIHYSPAELDIFKDNGITSFWRCNNLPVYLFNDISMSIFNCFELADIKLRSFIKMKIDLLVAIEYNYDTLYFSNILESVSRDLHCYCIQANAGNIGENRIVAPVTSLYMNVIRFKAGINSFSITEKIPIKRLQQFHVDSTTSFKTIDGVDIKFHRMPPI